MIDNHLLTLQEIIDNSLFNNDLSILFFNYAHNEYKNTMAKNMEDSGYSNFNKHDENFYFRHINPWEKFNLILNELNFKYNVQGIDKSKFNENMTYSVQYINRITKEQVSEQSFSTGEKTILKLAHCIFTSSWAEPSILPNILLLDEPDSSLHPQKVYEFIKFIKRKLVEELNIRVILTTHSPTTISMIEDENLFYMTNEDSIKIEKIKKNVALNKLTENIYTIDTKLENRKCVFVESEKDSELTNT